MNAAEQTVMVQGLGVIADCFLAVLIVIAFVLALILAELRKRRP